MSSGHVDEWIQRHLDGALPAREAAWVAEHLLACTRCRRIHGDVLAGRRALEALGPAPPDDAWSSTAWNAIERDIATPPRRARRWAVSAGIAAAVVLAASLALMRPGRPWSVESVAGRPVAGGDAVAKGDRLRLGEWLVTDADSRARLALRGIGIVDVEPGSRLRVVRAPAGTGQRRLELEIGGVRARVISPPRLFAVETPAGTVVDLGCEYTLAVDDAGATTIHVVSGLVEIGSGAGIRTIRAGAVVRLSAPSRN